MQAVLDQRAAELAAELSRWLAQRLPEGWRLPRAPSERIAWLRDWQRQMAEARWVAIHWPEEHGGRGATLEEQVAYHATLARHRAPGLIGNTGLSLCGPTILVHGSDEQRERFLPPMLRGDEIWCEGFSEPDAGSDLAGLRTRGVVDGDELVVTGQKIWTSQATIADWMFALVRTDPATAPGAHPAPGARKREGISFVLIPMDATGLDVRPILQISGDAEFCEVFLDEVRIPLTHVVGALNEGWQVARTTLSHERSTIFVAGQMRMARQIERIAALLAASVDPLTDEARADRHELRQRLAQAWIDAQLAMVHGARTFGQVAAGREPGPEAAVLKLFGQESEQRLYELALDIPGAAGLLDHGADDAPGNGRWVLGYLRTRASTIGGGTSEIQRNILAERVLGLPRDPWNP
ncbi:MAG: acyl-CoA dehydrogenase family protein [Actinobacteria bacterium]|nr:acyl-CoA dehydrogenase family protein [Actinomycetota bacterium]